MFYKSEGKIVDKNKIKELLGEDFCNDLLEVKEQIKLDRMIFGYFDRCFKIKELTKYNFLLNFLNKEMCLGFIYKKKVQGKNKVTRNLFSSVIEKFNGYGITRRQLARKKLR